MGKFIFKVSDMTCEGCAGKIRKALEAEPSVEDVEIDVSKHRVAASSAADRGRVAELIRSAGYTPEEMPRGLLGKIFGRG